MELRDIRVAIAVAGEVTYQNGHHTGALPGRVLRRRDRCAARGQLPRPHRRSG